MKTTEQVTQFTIQIPAMLILNIRANRETLSESDVWAVIKRHFDIDGTSLSSVIDGHGAQLELSPDAFHTVESEVIDDESDIYECAGCGETIAIEFKEYHDSNECEGSKS